MMHAFARTTDAVAAFEAQEQLQPGTEGWWKVWGAKAHHIRPGDLVLSKKDDGEVEYTLVFDLFPSKAAPLRVGVVTDDGKQYTFGALQPIIVLRWTDHNTLA